MYTSITQKKQNLHSINRKLLFWEILLSLVISAAVSVASGFIYYYMFDEGTHRLVFVLIMLLTGLCSFILLLIAARRRNNIILKKSLKMQVKCEPSSEDDTKVGVPVVEITANDSNNSTIIMETFDPAPINDPGNNKTFVDQWIRNHINFTAAETTQPVSNNTDKMSPEFIKRCLLEKETRIIEVVDVNVAKNVDHMYDFSATIYVTAKSLINAAEIVDSANSILEDEFNIKDTKLLPVITK